MAEPSPNSVLYEFKLPPFAFISRNRQFGSLLTLSKLSKFGESMRGLKTLNLRFLDSEYEYIARDKKIGESWETFLIRLASMVKRGPS